MPDEDKIKKPIIKVEELEEEAEEKETSADTKSSDEETFKITSETTTPVPAVSSFSQLDTAPPAPADEKTQSVLETPETFPSSEEQTSEPAKEREKSAEKTEGETSKKEQISSAEVKEWLKDVRPDTTKEVEKGRGPGEKL